ncbi:MAG: aminotransferase class IV [Solirubrobacteraceae bacterium]
MSELLPHLPGDALEPFDALQFGSRPDPALGIFETILVTDQVAQRLDLHLGRLQASARALYGLELDAAAVREAVTACARDLGCGRARLRLDLTPDGAIAVHGEPLVRTQRELRLVPYTLSGGLGCHKWADRRLVDALSAHALRTVSPAGRAGAESAERKLTVVPLVLDTDGAVLETVISNVLIEEHGRLLSPPEDGRALPGVGRQALGYSYAAVDLERLMAADAVVLTNALRTIRLAPGALVAALAGR